MAEPYLRDLTALLAQAPDASGRGSAVACKHFFAGAAAYADGRIFLSLTPVGLALKLPEDARATLSRQGAKPLRYFPKGPIKEDYVVVPMRLARDVAALAPWIARSIAFVRAGSQAGGLAATSRRAAPRKRPERRVRRAAPAKPPRAPRPAAPARSAAPRRRPP